jgi:hypothetical protein
LLMLDRILINASYKSMPEPLYLLRAIEWKTARSSVTA